MTDSTLTFWSGPTDNCVRYHALLDYLDGVDAVGDYLSEHEEKPIFVPSLALFEVYRGAPRPAGRDGTERVGPTLDWVEPFPLTGPAAREAALVEAEFVDAGDRTNLSDVPVAGIFVTTARES